MKNFIYFLTSVDGLHSHRGEVRAKDIADAAIFAMHDAQDNWVDMRVTEITEDW